MFKELDTVKLTHDITEHGLKKGDMGAVVTVYNNSESYEVEFVAPDGRTIALLTLDSADLRPSRRNSIPAQNEPLRSGFRQQI